MRVEVYWNLHKGRYSVRALEGPHKGHVIAHATGVHLRDVQFRVREAGRQRVLREKRKNVHAFVRGNLVDYTGTCKGGVSIETGSRITVDDVLGHNRARVTYNPYRYSKFVDADTEEPIYYADVAVLNRFDGRASMVAWTD